jgi:hypothetical protein
MIINQGWLCPKCNSAHAPDVKTCPGGAAFMGIPVQVATDCGCCVGAEAWCLNTVCPRRMYFTSKTDSKFSVGAAG